MDGRKTPLYDRHVAAGGKIVPFAGWLLPVQYSGVIAEHKAVRSACGLFDVSHMGELLLRGADALENVNRLMTNDFSGMAEGTYDMANASHTRGALLLWFTESRFSPGNNIFHVADLTPYTGLISQIKAASDSGARQALVDELQALLARERPFLPLWFGRTLHAQSPTVDNIDYPSSSFSNENVWEWTLQAG